MTIDLRTIEGIVSIQIPGTDLPAEGFLSSCIFDGLTLRLDAGPHIRDLHKLIVSGQVMGLSLIPEE